MEDDTLRILTREVLEHELVLVDDWETIGYDWSTIGRVVEALQERGMEVEMSTSPYFMGPPDYDDTVGHVAFVWQVPNENNYVKGSSNESMAEAVFEAAIKAVKLHD